MFLVGGPSHSGTTLLALLLNQGDVVCLDEPDFHNPEQNHRGVPVLTRLFPDRVFPERTTDPLTFEEATDVIAACERAIAPFALGVKTNNRLLLRYAAVFRRRGHPVIFIVRDIRDALLGELDARLDERAMNRRYRLVWRCSAKLADVVVRYEDLVLDPGSALSAIGAAIGQKLEWAGMWDPARVDLQQMVKTERQELLRRGTISSDRVGRWKTASRSFAARTHDTAERMGYGPA